MASILEVDDTKGHTFIQVQQLPFVVHAINYLIFCGFYQVFCQQVVGEATVSLDSG